MKGRSATPGRSVMIDMTGQYSLSEIFKEDEKPLDRIVSDGGFTAIFRTIACVGDSLSSGEFETKLPDGKTRYSDFYEYSWGQFIARMCGSKVYNFSKGGMTAKRYCTSFAEERGFWNPELAAQAYIVALGCNDLHGKDYYIGSVDDICLEDWTKNKDTYAGWYGAVVQRYKEISPDAKFFFVSMVPGADEVNNIKVYKQAQFMKELTGIFDNSYVIDLATYGEKYDTEFRDSFYLRGHMNPCGYLYSAKIISSYIDYIIRHNMKDFRRVGLINTELSDSNLEKMYREAGLENIQ